MSHDEGKADANTNEELAPEGTPPPFAFLECISASPPAVSSPHEARTNSYLKYLAEKVSETWFPPVERLNSQVQLKFAIARDGNLQVVKFVRQSVNKYANIAVEDAVQSAGPFNSLPLELGEEATFVLTINDALCSKDRSGITFESVE